ncbi:MAG: hypothetical protein UV58_C0005G0041 [Candidatus Wolfebacteria bacterium GW2011_GWC1_43_10]|uniref:N-acetyltransferase domain-containing protein n=2 Tax=Candidatus Wolfeibacteriota TaxID=1752735 RepID=A0A0G1CB67_9BACT|nr:MAG: hypothetical protein UV58_C0005G0041 [Candidatus Wolfebacteria bacterium GW2011_GWC1_43_10]KKT23174.1 MAG: hypothetical protein UW08_C0001G0137 [Parcubacteria group bacterium GW2011_GWB1_43_8b]OGM89288.1 MAG: hypothetical protein A2108_00235 [Candidatus Wolfebacteria bacterium GWA1_42_9]
MTNPLEQKRAESGKNEGEIDWNYEESINSPRYLEAVKRVREKAKRQSDNPQNFLYYIKDYMWGDFWIAFVDEEEEDKFIGAVENSSPEELVKFVNQFSEESQNYGSGTDILHWDISSKCVDAVVAKFLDVLTDAKKEKGDEVYRGLSNTWMPLVFDFVEYMKKTGAIPDDYQLPGYSVSENSKETDAHLYLRFKEQFLFVEYLRNNPGKAEILERLSLKYGLGWARAFLSLEHDRKMGDKLISIGNELRDDAARAIFDKFSEIVGAAWEIEKYLKENFGEEKRFFYDTMDRISESTMRRGTDLLARLSEMPPDQILGELEKIKTETLLFLSSFRALKKGGHGIDFETIKDIEFRSVEGAEISPKDIERMREIYRGNYASQPELCEKLLEVFDQALNNPKTAFYILRYKGEIVSFLRFDEGEKEDRLYLGSVNVAPDFRGSAIGEAIMEKTVDMKAKESVLDADCNALSDIGAHYLETGFVAVRLYDYAGVPSFQIERNDRKNYPGKSMSRKDMVEKSKDQPLSDFGDFITSSSLERNPEALNFGLLDRGFVLSRYFKDGQRWYCLFEKRKELEVERKAA